MLEFLSVVDVVCTVLSFVAPFTFVFSLIDAIRETFSEGDDDVLPGIIAAVSLFVIVVACML